MAAKIASIKLVVSRVEIGSTSTQKIVPLRIK